MIEVLSQLVDAAGVLGVVVISGVGAVGTIMGIVQSLVGRSLNLWPLQIATLLMTGVAGVVISAYRLLENYLQIGTVSAALQRSELTMTAYIDSLLIIKASLVVLFIHVIVSVVGRVFFVNGADPSRLRIPKRGAAVTDLQGAPGPDQHSNVA